MSLNIILFGIVKESLKFCVAREYRDMDLKELLLYMDDFS